MAKNTQTTAEAIEKIKQQEEYGKYVKKMTPVHSLPKNMARAFLSGGIICTIGQGIMNILVSFLPDLIFIQDLQNGEEQAR